MRSKVLTDSLQPDPDPIEAIFELNDTLYAKAHVPPTEEVYLWLGVRIDFPTSRTTYTDSEPL